MSWSNRARREAAREAVTLSKTAQTVAAGLRQWVDAAIAGGASTADVAGALADAAGYATGRGSGPTYEETHRLAQRAFDARRRETFQSGTKDNT